MQLRLACLLFTVIVFTSCKSTHEEIVDVPLTLQTFPAAYSSRALELADKNRDGYITRMEWINAGGDSRSFEMVDQNKDGVVTRSELVRISDNAQFFDFTRRYADFDRDNKLTPREFRAASGVQVLRFNF